MQNKFYPPEKLDLWYDSPTFDDSDPNSRDGINWEREALLIGNGHMGAILYGGIQEEELTLNEKTLWQGGPYTRREGETAEDCSGSWKKAAEAFPKLRQMIFTAENHEVDPEIARNMLLGNPDNAFFWEKFGAYQTLCDLKMSMEHRDTAEHYIRGLDLKQALSLVDYRTDGVHFQREYFMNYPDNVLAARLIADTPGALSFTLRLAGRQPDGFSVTAEGNRLILAGALPDHWQHTKDDPRILHGNGMKYEAEAALAAEGGCIITGEDFLRVEHADEAVILFTAGTDYLPDYDRDYRGEDPHEAVSARLSAAEELGYEALKARHLADYCPLYNRVSLRLGGEKPDKSTARLTEDYQTAPEEEKRWLEALTFDMGRYLLLASSRSGSLPANLQGVWNPMTAPTWESDYHININLEMNYWAADLLNLPETLIPLTDFIIGLQKPGKVTAENIYGFRDGSWVTHNPVNPLGHTGLQFYGPGLWFPEGSGWLLRHLFDHYYFTRDSAFLRKIYPVLQGNIRFWLNYLVEDPLDPGVLICCPTCLPEQPPYTMAASMSMQVAEDLLRNFITLSEEMEELSEEDILLLNQAKETWKKLDHGLRTDKQEGIIRDWKYKPSRTGGCFRHFNQLYAFYPADSLDFAEESREELLQGAASFLNQRGMDGTPGWSRVWRCALWSRIGNGEKALAAASSILQPAAMGHNLLMRHPPFQIDANLGYPAALAEMLIQSQGKVLSLLPSLPESWTAGSFTGFAARGGFLVDAVWKNHTLQSAAIHARQDGMLTFRAPALRNASFRCGENPVRPERCGTEQPGAFRIYLQAGDTLSIENS